MKKVYITILMTVFCLTAKASYYYNGPTRTYDYSDTCESGQILYYIITSDSTVAITYPSNLTMGASCYFDQGGYSHIRMAVTNPYRHYYPGGQVLGGGDTVWQEYINYDGQITNIVKPTGKLLIPSQVEINNMLYSVTEIENYAFYQCYLTSIVIPPKHTNYRGLCIRW